jgi:hypothetical protein
VGEESQEERERVGEKAARGAGEYGKSFSRR